MSPEDNPSAMTPEEQRVAIAEACGFTAIRLSSPWECSDPPDDAVVLCGITKGSKYPEPLPDYLSDLNAIHEAEKVLTSEECDSYENFMFWDESGKYPLWKATATQRAEAFCRVKYPERFTPTPAR